jgi:hypothetical protein
VLSTAKLEVQVLLHYSALLTAAGKLEVQESH